MGGSMNKEYIDEDDFIFLDSSTDVVKHVNVLLKTIREREKEYKIDLLKYKVEKEAFDYLSDWIKNEDNNP